MPNDNALQGITCPNCGQADEFQITATATFDVTDEGTGDYTGVEWDDNSPITCQKCNRMGRVKDFTPQESYVLIHEEDGLFLGDALGLAFWSRMDSLDLTEAPSFTQEHAQALANLHEDDRIKLHRVPTPPRHHTPTELDAYGLSAYTRELHENTNPKSAQA